MKYSSVTIRMKATKQYFFLVLLAFQYFLMTFGISFKFKTWATSGMKGYVHTNCEMPQ